MSVTQHITHDNLKLILFIKSRPPTTNFTVNNNCIEIVVKDIMKIKDNDGEEKEVVVSEKTLRWSRVFLDTPEIYLHVRDDGSVAFLETWYFAPNVAHVLSSSQEKRIRITAPRKSKELDILQKRLMDASRSLIDEKTEAELALLPTIPRILQECEEEADDEENEEIDVGENSDAEKEESEFEERFEEDDSDDGGKRSVRKKRKKNKK